MLNSNKKVKIVMTQTDPVNLEALTESSSTNSAPGDSMKKFPDIDAVRAAKRKYVVYQNQVLDVEGFEHPGS